MGSKQSRAFYCIQTYNPIEIDIAIAYKFGVQILTWLIWAVIFSLKTMI